MFSHNSTYMITVWEEDQKKELALEAAYEAANQEDDRIETLCDWDTLDVLTCKDENEDEDWSWLKDSND